VARPAAPPGWYPDPWGMGAVRWWDGHLWTGLVHGSPWGIEVPARDPLHPFPMRAGVLGFAVLLLSLLAIAVVAGILYYLGAPDWFATALIAIGGYAPVFLYVWWASRHWGTGKLGDDLGFRIRVVDIGWGPLTLLACWAALIGVGALTMALGLPQGSNTEGLFDEEGSWAVTVVIAISAVVVAPIVEELLFRGLILRSFLSKFAAPWAILFQALLFGSVHLTPGIGWGNVSLVLALSAVGAVLGTTAVLTRRLAPGMIAHAILNLVALTVAFFAT